MEISLLIFLLITLLIISGFCSASETAFFSLSATKIKTYESSNNPRHQLVAELLRHPRDLLVTVFMVNTFVNIMVQSTASSLFGTAASWTLKVGVPFLLLLILGEIIPKYLGIQNSVRLSNLLAPLTMFIQNLLAPIRKAVIAVTAPISQVLFFFLRKEKSISRAELQHVLQQSEEHQVLRPDETELVWGYLNLQDTSIKELMRPREDILAYNLKDPLSKLTYLFIDLQCTRIPVYEDTIEQIVGVITAKRFFLNRESIRCPQDLHPFLKKPFFVPENTSARILLRRFEEKNEVMAIVVDEYGSISGLVTYEDLIEVVVGEITDLRDKRTLYTRAGQNEIIASGKLELDDFNEIFQSDLVSPNNMITIGGWLIERMGEIPKAGTHYEAENFLFHVLEAHPNRLRRLYIRKLTSEKK